MGLFLEVVFETWVIQGSFTLSRPCETRAISDAWLHTMTLIPQLMLFVTGTSFVASESSPCSGVPPRDAGIRECCREQFQLTQGKSSSVLWQEYKM